MTRLAVPPIAAVAPVEAAADGRRRWRRPGWWPAGWAGVAAAVGLLLLAVLVLRATALVALMQSDADLSAPLVMAEQAHRYTDAQLATGRLGWWGGLWFLQLVRPLPGNSYLGSYLPLLVMGAVALGVARTAARLWSPRAHWVVLLVALAVGAETWANLAAWSARAPTWWAMGLLGVATVGAARADRRRGTLVLVAGLAALVTVLASSGDQLAAVPLAGMVAAGGYALWAGRRRLAVGLVGSAAAIFVAGQVVAAAADRAGYLQQEYPIQLVDFGDLGASFSNLLLATQDVWRGAQGGSRVEAGVAATIGSLAGYLGFLLVCVGVVWIGRVALRAWRRRDAIPNRAATGSDRELQRGLWVVFWATCLIACLVAFWLTTASGPLGHPVTRYLYGVPLALGAVLAPLVERRWGGRLLATVSLLGVLAVGSLALHRPEPVPMEGRNMASSAVLGRIGEVAVAERATRGFAGYWMSYPLVLNSGFALDVTPVGSCTATVGICAMYLHYIDQAYAPRADVHRSFLVIDGSERARELWRNAVVTELPPGLVPEKRVPVGDGVEVAIFPYDLATRLQPNRDQLDPRVGRGGPLEPQ